MSTQQTPSFDDERFHPECLKIISELYVYLDGELDEHRRLSIQKHLDLCPPCVDAFDFEADLRRLIADRCRDSVPEDLRERIRRALADEL